MVNSQVSLSTILSSDREFGDVHVVACCQSFVFKKANHRNLLYNMYVRRPACVYLCIYVNSRSVIIAIILVIASSSTRG